METQHPGRSGRTVKLREKTHALLARSAESDKAFQSS